MRTWRIAEEDVALDRSCEGARKSGGHWHFEGWAALYTAMTVELAVLEKFVHSEGDQRDLVLVAVDLPDDPELGVDVSREELPQGWDDLEDGGSAARFGTSFLEKCHHLYMRVPSGDRGGGREPDHQSGASGLCGREAVDRAQLPLRSAHVQPGRIARSILW